MMANPKTEYKTIRAQTRRMINGEEGIDVEFKRSHAEVSPQYFVAFANATGGSIIVGVEETKDESGRQKAIIVGCEVNDRTKRALLSRANSCRPKIPIEVTVENSNDKPIYRIDVPEGPSKPYCTEKGTYKIRLDGANAAIDPPMMAAIILEREAGQFVARFRQAADGITGRLVDLESRLARRIGQVEWAAEEAERAAREASDAAHEAIDAAVAAADAASSLQV